VQPFSPRLIVPLLILLSALSAGCAAPAAQALVLTPSSTTAPSATPFPTSTALPSPTTIPSPTPRPTSTPPPSPTPVPTPPPLSRELTNELQAILDDLVADGFIPGAVLAIRVPGYALWSGASGFVDRGGAQAMTPETRVRIASITKVFTAVVVLQLVEEGQLDLETPLSTWYPALVPHAEHITVRRLLNHTTGLFDYLEDRSILGKAYQVPNYSWLPGELAAYAGERGFLFAPGTPDAWDYSSTNYVILGMVVEAVTGSPLSQEMRRRIFEPLGLTSTYFVPDDQVEDFSSRGHLKTSDVTDVSLSFAYATANIVSTAGDVARFGDALFGGKLLRPETMEQMFTFQNCKGQYNMPALEYGLGVMRNRLPVGPDAQGTPRPADTSSVLGHTGGFGGFRSVLWHAPESGVTIALGENQAATDPNILATRVLDAVLRAQGR
jgi:D-alanyl-D-alanine carboxypeptidase